MTNQPLFQFSYFLQSATSNIDYVTDFLEFQHGVQITDDLSRKIV